MRLLIDMNLTPRWVEYVVSAGHSAVHWSTIGPINEPDSEICQYCREGDLVLVTNDLDFPQILAHTAASKPSVILLRGEPLTPEKRGESLLQAIESCSEEIERRSDPCIGLVWTTHSTSAAAQRYLKVPRRDTDSETANNPDRLK